MEARAVQRVVAAQTTVSRSIPLALPAPAEPIILPALIPTHENRSTPVLIERENDGHGENSQVAA